MYSACALEAHARSAVQQQHVFNLLHASHAADVGCCCRVLQCCSLVLKYCWALIIWPSPHHVGGHAVVFCMHGGARVHTTLQSCCRVSSSSCCQAAFQLPQLYHINSRAPSKGVEGSCCNSIDSNEAPGPLVSAAMTVRAACCCSARSAVVCVSAGHGCNCNVWRRRQLGS